MLGTGVINLPQSFSVELEFGLQQTRKSAVAHRISLHMLIFGGTFGYSRHANQLWSQQICMSTVAPNSKLKLNCETLPLTEAFRIHWYTAQKVSHLWP